MELELPRIIISIVCYRRVWLSLVVSVIRYITPWDGGAGLNHVISSAQ